MTSDWPTSSYPGSQGNCAEVANAAPTVRIRDTKDRGRRDDHHPGRGPARLHRHTEVIQAPGRE
jgi:hypothetical protein